MANEAAGVPALLRDALLTDEQEATPDADPA